MTTVTTGPVPAEVSPDVRPALTAITRIEARHILAGPAFLVGLAFSAAFMWEGVTADTSWATDRYMRPLPNLMPLLIGVAVAVNGAALRDRADAVLAPHAPLDDDDRRLARVLAGLGPVAVILVVALAGGAAVWASGGVWLGEGARRAQRAYSLPELLQFPLLVAVAASFGAALARVRASRAFGASVAFFVLFLTCGAYWIWQAVSPATCIVLVQPFDVELAPDRGPGFADGPATTWRLQPTVAAWHDLYLLALAVLLGALAWRGRRARALPAAAAAVAIVAAITKHLTIVS